MSEEQSTYSANPGKQLVRTVDRVDYQRIPVKTHLITNTDDMADVVVRYAKDRMQEGDILFISEKAVRLPQLPRYLTWRMNVNTAGDGGDQFCYRCGDNSRVDGTYEMDPRSVAVFTATEK